jgi:glucosylceramidase
MKKIAFAFVIILFVSCDQKKEDKPAFETAPSSFTTEGKKIIVYTTADSSNFRLSVTDTLEFIQKGQPFENEITIFVDPSKTFQTFFGIGAALTDASAETFYKLPKA